MTRMLVVLAGLLASTVPVGAQDAAQQTLPRLEQPFAAPDFELPADDGTTHRLRDYRGKVVVLNFWATWCPPCRDEMPAMERAWQKTKARDVMLLGINVGEDADTIFEFTGQYPVSFPLLMDRDSTVIKQYPVTGLPTTFVIDSKGQARYRAVGGREWDDPAIIQQLLDLRAAP